MQKGKVLNLSKLKLINYFTQNKTLIISLIIFILGIIFGILIEDKYETFTNFTVKFLEGYINLRKTGRFLKIFSNSLFSYLLILLFFLISGTSLFGVVTVPISLCFCGIFFGNITSYLYSEYSLKGIAFNAVILIPSSIIFLILLIFVCKESVNFSLKISSLTITKGVSYNLPNQFKRFLILFLIFTGVAIISAVFNSIISLSFIKYFQF